MPLQRLQGWCRETPGHPEALSVDEDVIQTLLKISGEVRYLEVLVGILQVKRPLQLQRKTGL